jgi:hypothetical protein
MPDAFFVETASYPYMAPTSGPVLNYGVVVATLVVLAGFNISQAAYTACEMGGLRACEVARLGAGRLACRS